MGFFSLFWGICTWIPPQSHQTASEHPLNGHPWCPGLPLLRCSSVHQPPHSPLHAVPALASLVRQLGSLHCIDPAVAQHSANLTGPFAALGAADVLGLCSHSLPPLRSMVADCQRIRSTRPGCLATCAAALDGCRLPAHLLMQFVQVGADAR